MTPEIFIKKYTHILPLKATVVFDAYWQFAAERQNIFMKQITGHTCFLTSDPILSEYKFTNTYRASDRVSQYLIKNVIYDGEQSPQEIFFRIMLFKIFNKIETWESLKRKFGEISFKNYNFNMFSDFLMEEIKNKAIFSAAYIMPTRSKGFEEKKKHNNYLLLLEKMINDRVHEKICDTRKLMDVFALLRSYPLMGDFLAFQFAIDINYSNMTNFSEMSFVVAGPGAKNGINKCFYDLGGLTYIDVIQYVTEIQEQEFKRLGLNFKSLFGRPLQLIDCQNIFCEIDKYSRIAYPEVAIPKGRTRIKQKYKRTGTNIEYYYPPKWNINEKISAFIDKQK